MKFANWWFIFVAIGIGLCCPYSAIAQTKGQLGLMLGQSFIPKAPITPNYNFMAGAFYQSLEWKRLLRLSVKMGWQFQYSYSRSLETTCNGQGCPEGVNYSEKSIAFPVFLLREIVQNRRTKISLYAAAGIVPSLKLNFKTVSIISPNTKIITSQNSLRFGETRLVAGLGMNIPSGKNLRIVVEPQVGYHRPSASLTNGISNDFILHLNAGISYTISH